MAPSPCLVCGTPAKRSRCARHRTKTDPRTTDARGLGRAHQAIAHRVISAWVREHGWVCPGWRRPEHPVPPGGLTADHVIPRSVRPDLALDPANYGVLCAPCNSAKGNRV